MKERGRNNNDSLPLRAVGLGDITGGVTGGEKGEKGGRNGGEK